MTASVPDDDGSYRALANIPYSVPIAHWAVNRYIQHKMDSATDEVKASVFAEVLPATMDLIVDVFGNYVIQK
jgi:hypothetical protein